MIKPRRIGHATFETPDVERMIDCASACGMPEVEWWAGLWDRTASE